MARPFNIDTKQRHSSQSATRSNISFGHFQRMAPFAKMKNIFSKFNLKGKGNSKDAY